MADDIKNEKKKIQDERKKLKEEQKRQQKEAKKRAKELSDQEAELDDDAPGGGFSMFLVTIFIIAIWIAILCILIKLDVGGLGTNVMTPILKDIPVVNKILPADQTTETQDQEAYYGYTSLADAVAQIQALELELSSVQSSNTTYVEEIEQLKAEVQRLQTFESQQVEFQRIKTEFYEEVIYAENGPGPEAYKEYFESIDPTTAEYLYQQVVQNLETDSQMSDYAQGYAKMDPAAAAKIFDNMTNNLDLVAEILWAMDASSRGNILANMDPEIAAQVTKLMNP
ncbi:MAG: hypothetical protein J6K26_04715 [Lachnospiraceae bacterium]|nr:hypothetical protein [Lachnospiraceae bacterium]